MKTLAKIIVLFCALPIVGLAQSEGEFAKNLTPPSPEAASLGKFGEFPVSYYTGTPSIEVPFFEINTGRISVPIKLKYHASGVKVEEMPSRVGLGWALEAGGVVTRSVKGVPDESLYNNGNGPGAQMYGFFRKSSYSPTDILSGNDTYDAGPDMHFYSFPGGGGKMIFSTGASPKLYTEQDIIIDDPYDPNDVTGFDMNIGTFKITTNDGLIYTFGEKETTEFVTVSAGGGLNLAGAKYISAWYLTKIEDPITDREVTFTYASLGELSIDMNRSQTFGITGGSGALKSGSNSTNIKITTKVLDRIDFDYGYVLFLRDLDREDFDGDEAITEIKIFNTSDELQKRYELNYDHAHISGNTAAIDKRLYLESVQEFGSSGTVGLPKYEFEYPNINLLPARDSKEQDIWGYFNDNGATTLKPTLYVYPSRTREKLMPIQSGTPTYTLTNADRAAVESYAMYGMLDKITYPTGGYTEFDFELNKFSNNGNTIEGGGLRIAEIRNYTNGPTPVTTKTFDYESGAIPSIMPQHAFLGTTWSTGNGQSYYEDNAVVSATNQASLGENNGGYVGYSKVTERMVDGSNNDIGKTEYHYRQEKDFEQTTGYSLTARGLNPPTQLASDLKTYSYFPFTQFMDKSQRRGLLTFVKQFDKNDNLVHQTQYGYGELSTILEQTPLMFDYDYERSSVVTSDLVNGITIYSKVTQDIDVDRLMQTSITETNYDDSGNGSTSFKSFTYNDHIMTESVTTSLGSEVTTGQGATTVWSKSNRTDYYYPFDFSGTDANGTIQDMLDAHYLTPVIRKDIKVNDSNSGVTNKLVASEVTLFKDEGSLILPHKTYTAKIATPGASISGASDPASLSSDYKEQISYDDYDSHGRMLEATAPGGETVNFEWENNVDTYPKARFVNGGADTYYGAENFEYSSGWFTGGILSSAGAKTGSKFMDTPFGNNEVWYYPPANSSGKDIHVSFWIKGGSAYLENGDSETSSTGTVGANWEYKTLKLPAITYLKLFTDADIDEFRFSSNPNTLITTYTYDPFRGLKAICDPSGLVTNYEYDIYGRLEAIRDVNGNLVKSFSYKYSTQQ